MSEQVSPTTGSEQSQPESTQFHERVGYAGQSHVLVVKHPDYYAARTGDVRLNSYEDWYTYVFNEYCSTFLHGNDDNFKVLSEYIEDTFGPKSNPMTVQKYAELGLVERALIENVGMGRNKVILLRHQSGNREGYPHFEITRKEHKDRGAGFLWDPEEKKLRLAEGRITCFPDENRPLPNKKTRINFIPMFPDQADPSAIDLKAILREYDVTDLARYIVQKTDEYYNNISEHNKAIQNRNKRLSEGQPREKQIPIIRLSYETILEGLQGLRALPSAAAEFPSPEIEVSRHNLLWVVNETPEPFPFAEMTIFAIGNSGIRLSKKSQKRLATIDSDPKVLEIRKSGQMTWGQFVDLFPSEIQPHIRQESVAVAQHYMPIIEARRVTLEVERGLYSQRALNELNARRVIATGQYEVDINVTNVEVAAHVKIAQLQGQQTVIQLEAGVKEASQHTAALEQLFQAQDDERQHSAQAFEEELEVYRQSVRILYTQARDMLLQIQGNRDAQEVAGIITAALDRKSPEGELLLEGSDHQMKLLSDFLTGNADTLPQLPATIHNMPGLVKHQHKH